MLNQKSRLASFFLTLFFGPLGLLYSSVTATILMLVAFVLLVPMTAGAALVFLWPLTIAIGDHATHGRNQAVKQTIAALRVQ